eukprot:COSAG02_NODE_46312_length_350_cov_0.593625_1_plen_39_part_01
MRRLNRYTVNVTAVSDRAQLLQYRGAAWVEKQGYQYYMG